MEDRRPFELLSEAVWQAKNSAVPPDASPRGRDLAEQFLNWARLVVATSQSLTHHQMDLPLGSDGIPIKTSDILRLIESDLLAETFDFVILELGERQITGARTRLPDLLGVLVTRPANAFTERYLERVGRLYLWGYHVEVHVMCRAVLDAALQELIPGEIAKDLVPRKRNYANQVTLHDRLCLAQFTTPQILTADEWLIAWKLKEDGNDVLHEDVDHTLYFPDALEAIRNLRVVLEAMPATGTGIVVNPVPKGYDCNKRPGA